VCFPTWSGTPCERSESPSTAVLGTALATEIGKAKACWAVSVLELEGVNKVGAQVHRRPQGWGISLGLYDVLDMLMLGSSHSIMWCIWFVWCHDLGSWRLAFLAVISQHSQGSSGIWGKVDTDRDPCLSTCLVANRISWRVCEKVRHKSTDLPFVLD
jgi:hypothetical protein